MTPTNTLVAPYPKAVHPAKERYDGWLNSVRRSVPAQRVETLENIVRFAEGWTELSRFKWFQRVETTWHTEERCYFLSLVLDRAPEAERRNIALSRTAPYSGRRASLVPPNQTICSWSSDSGEVHAMRCFLDAALIESVCARKPTEQELIELSAIDLSGGTIEWLLFRMYREVSDARIGTALVVESLARTIAVEIARTLEERSDTRHRIGGLPAWRIRLLLERIHADGPLPNVSELAETCSMSARHLSRAFRDETGKTLGQCIADVMVERAGRMLEAGVPVGTIATSLGYSSSGSFAHAFHRQTGVLPSRFKGAIRVKQAN